MGNAGRRARITEPRDRNRESRGHGATWLQWVFVSVFLSCVTFALGLLIGGIAGTLQIYHNRYFEVKSAIDDIIRNDPKFKNIHPKEASNGGVWLFGDVANEEDLHHVKSVLKEAMGEHELEKLMFGVGIRKSEPGTDDDVSEVTQSPE